MPASITIVYPVTKSLSLLHKKPRTTFATSSSTDTLPISVTSVLYFFRLSPFYFPSISPSFSSINSHIAVPTIPEDFCP